MTREEAIELLDDLDGAIEDNHGRDYDEALDMAIEALQIDVVRCKDCKHTMARPDGEIYCEKLDMEEIPVSHFCGWGESKGGDDE